MLRKGALNLHLANLPKSQETGGKEEKNNGIEIINKLLLCPTYFAVIFKCRIHILHLEFLQQ